MKQFLAYLENHAPAIGKRLIRAGNSNTESTEGHMPKVWKQIAKEMPEQFEKLQQDFAIQNYYIPIAKSTSSWVPNTPAIQELLFSTAIQHGVHGAESIIQKAMQKKKQDTTISEFITNVYTLRKHDFPSSPKHIQKSIAERLTKEMHAILAIL